MRAKVFTAMLLSLFVVARGWTTDNPALPANSPAFTLPSAEAQTPDPAFTDAQMAFVQSWIRQKAPECPPDISRSVAQQFLEELQLHHPGKLDQLTSSNFPSGDFESVLLRYVAAKMTGANYQSAREEIARRRIGAIQVARGRDPRAALTEAGGILEKIRDGSQTQYRRVVDGRMDDDDLQLQIKKAVEIGATKTAMEPVKPKVMTASEIVAEFSRRNQIGSALQRLQAYVVEGHIRTPAGEEQQILLFRMRPDCFRLVVRVGGVTRYILASSEGRFWQYLPDKAPQGVPAQALGQRQYLSEFIDPLFAGENFNFQKLEEGDSAGKKYYRVGVKRADGSTYVTQIDRETFREVGRENEDHSIARYSDFREIAGVTFSFHEELTDNTGKTGVFELVRVSANPGLIRDFFEPPARSNFGYYDLESWLGPAPASALKFN